MGSKVIFPITIKKKIIVRNDFGCSESLHAQLLSSCLSFTPTDPVSAEEDDAQCDCSERGTETLTRKKLLLDKAANVFLISELLWKPISPPGDDVEDPVSASLSSTSLYTVPIHLSFISEFLTHPPLCH